MHTVPRKPLLRAAAVLALLALLALTGCRTVWRHEQWSEAKYQQDFNECRAEARSSRAYREIQTRTCTVDAETGEEACIQEVSSRPPGEPVNWKNCMMERGWDPRTGFRWEDVSKPR